MGSTDGFDPRSDPNPKGDLASAVPLCLSLLADSRDMALTPLWMNKKEVGFALIPVGG